MKKSLPTHKRTSSLEMKCSRQKFWDQVKKHLTGQTMEPRSIKCSSSSSGNQATNTTKALTCEMGVGVGSSSCRLCYSIW